MSLKQRLNEDIKTAMRASDKARLTTLRMATAAIKQREVDERIELDDSAVLAVIEKMIKQRRDAAEQYQQGNRPELAAAEHAEIDILQDYLPEPLSESELDALVAAAISEAGATSVADMGKVMASLKPAVQGRADMSAVSARVRALLGA
jgi:uncharacterized protein YqeY